MACRVECNVVRCRVRSPKLERFADKFRPVVATDVSGFTPVINYLVEHRDQFLGRDAVMSFGPQSPTRAFIHDVDDAYLLSGGTNYPVAHEIHSPTFIDAIRTEKLLIGPINSTALGGRT